MTESFNEVNIVAETSNDIRVKCENCGEMILQGEFIENYKVCPHCSHHFRLTARERISYTVDRLSFEEFDSGVCGNDPLKFPGYGEKLSAAREKLDRSEAVMCGLASIEGTDVVVCAMDGFFIMGSMGMAVGEKITRAIEYAAAENLPIVIFTVSGGARMQEGIISLMQMAKVSAALTKHDEKGLLYVTVLTDPTTGGVTASFAMLGDIIISEPKALVGFAGKRVIEQTIKQTIDDRFQTAEFLLERGFIDRIVDRRDIKRELSVLLKIHAGRERGLLNER